jgi:hypothetical protein
MRSSDLRSRMPGSRRSGRHEALDDQSRHELRGERDHQDADAPPENVATDRARPE